MFEIEDERVIKFSELSMRKDVNFKLVLAKNDKLNHDTLRNLLTAFLKRKIYNLQVLSEELKLNSNYDKQQIFDILVDSREEISMLVECVNQISRDEKEWLEQGRQEGKIELILMMANNTTCEEISKITGLDIEYVQSVA